MPRYSSLSFDQMTRIESTLTRIQSGLRAFKAQPKEEPAMVFNPEAFNDRPS